MDTNQFSDYVARPTPVDGAGLGGNAVHEAYHLMGQQLVQKNDTEPFSVDKTADKLFRLASKTDKEANEEIHNLLSTDGPLTDSQRNDVLFAVHKINPDSFKQLQAKEPEAFERFAETSLRDLRAKLSTGKTSANTDGAVSKSGNSSDELHFDNPYGDKLETSWNDTTSQTVLEDFPKKSNEVSHVEESKNPSTDKVSVPKPEAPASTTADNTNTDSPIVDNPDVDKQPTKKYVSLSEIKLPEANPEVKAQDSSPVDQVPQSVDQPVPVPNQAKGGDDKVTSIHAALKNEQNHLESENDSLRFKKISNGDLDTIEIKMYDDKNIDSYKLQFDSKNNARLEIQYKSGGRGSYAGDMKRQRDGGIDISATTDVGEFKYRHKSLSANNATAGDIIQIPGKVIETFENSRVDDQGRVLEPTMYIDTPKEPGSEDERFDYLRK